MVEIKRVKQIEPWAPNIIAVINYPDNPIGVPTRGYIFDVGLGAYEGIDNKSGKENAIRHFLKRAKTIHPYAYNFQNGKTERKKFLYTLCSIKGKLWKNRNGIVTIIDKDIVVLPFEESGGPQKAKTHAYMIKARNESGLGGGSVVATTPNEMEDMYSIVGDEIHHRRTNSRDEFINTFPEIRGIGYID